MSVFMQIGVIHKEKKQEARRRDISQDCPRQSGAHYHCGVGETANELCQLSCFETSCNLPPTLGSLLHLQNEIICHLKRFLPTIKIDSEPRLEGDLSIILLLLIAYYHEGFLTTDRLSTNNFSFTELY